MSHVPKDVVISIHALLAESDFVTCREIYDARGFLSTLSLRRATFVRDGFGHHILISIHALLAESDRCPADTGFPG